MARRRVLPAARAGKVAGNSVGSALGGLGGRMNAATKPAAAPAAPASTTMALPANVPAGAPGIVTVAGPQPEIHFDVVTFQKCAGGVSSSKVDLPADGDYVSYHCQPVSQMISFAYAGGAASELNLTGYPSWAATELFDLEAKVAPEDVTAWQALGLSARKIAVRKLLADELKLKVHVKTTPKSVYTLQVALSGPKLKEYKEGEHETLPNGLTLNGKDMTWVGRGCVFPGHVDGWFGGVAERAPGFCGGESDGIGRRVTTSRSHCRMVREPAPMRTWPRMCLQWRSRWRRWACGWSRARARLMRWWWTVLRRRR